MVNLTFYRLDVPYLIISDNSEAHILYFHFSYPFSGTIIYVGISFLIF